KSVIYQFAKGDQSGPNPTNTAILRAGGLADRTTFYRHDLAYAENPGLPKNPHVFLTSIDNAAFAVIARGAQEQAAIFFASDGRVIIHPEPARFFEVPIVLPLPQRLNFIPRIRSGGESCDRPLSTPAARCSLQRSPRLAHSRR